MRAVWPVFLCHVKLNGNNRGRCKSISRKAFARMHDIPSECVEAFFDAADSHGAVNDADGNWDVSGWNEYQSPDAARMRKARTEPNEPEQPAPVRNEDELSVTSAACSDSCHATLTETQTGTVVEPTVLGEGAGDEKSTVTGFPATGALTWEDGADYWAVANEPVRAVGLCLCAVALALDDRMPIVSKVMRYVGDAQPCRNVVEQLGWKEAAEVYVWAVKSSYTKSWTTVWDNLAAYRFQMRNGVGKPQASGRAALPASRESVEDKTARRVAMMTGEPNAA